MKSLYYKSLNAHMRKSRKEQDMQEMLDQVHNLNLKQKLNTDLKREQAILNPIAVDLKHQEITDKYKEHLDQFKEQKLRRKAEDKAKIDLYKQSAQQLAKKSAIISTKTRTAKSGPSRPPTMDEKFSNLSGLINAKGRHKYQVLPELKATRLNKFKSRLGRLDDPSIERTGDVFRYKPKKELEIPHRELMGELEYNPYGYAIKSIHNLSELPAEERYTKIPRKNPSKISTSTKKKAKARAEKNTLM